MTACVLSLVSELARKMILWMHLHLHLHLSVAKRQVVQPGKTGTVL